jgi:hypothetical protein
MAVRMTNIGKNKQQIKAPLKRGFNFVLNAMFILVIC